MYENFFKLDALPFSLTPNPHFFCQLEGHLDALNTLEFCIYSGEELITITGKLGTGKTLLCRKLMEKIDKSYKAFYISNPDENALEIYKLFSHGLGIDTKDCHGPADWLEKIREHLLSLRRMGKKAVLLIDDAHTLSLNHLEAIQSLHQLRTDSSTLLQIALVAEPSLQQKLNHPSVSLLKKDISFSYSLSPMKKNDLEAYLNHRLAIAGYTDGELFTKKARKLLYRVSGGLPLSVNILSHQALIAAHDSGKHQIDYASMLSAVKSTEIKRITKRRTIKSLLLGIFAFSMLMASLGYLYKLVG